MPRTDLLTLSLDDLGALSTRGKVKEALKDLDHNGITGTLDASDDGAVRVAWSDGRTSELPAGATLRAGRCSCGAIDPCKHLVRLVLLYQRAVTAAGPVEATEPWDPGQISDEELGRHFRPAALERIRKQYEAGVLAEVIREVRPVAQFEVPPCRVRFLVPGDPRYTQCGCAAPSPCEHVPLAVWAFRALAAERHSGIVSAGAEAAAVAADLLEEMEQTLREMAVRGISGAGQYWGGQLTRLAERCVRADLVWPAGIVNDLLRAQESYAAHDARFEPTGVADLVGELVVRLDAIRSATGAVPQRLIRGTTGDRAVRLGFGEYLGLGTGVRLGRRHLTVVSYLHDLTSGSVVAVTRDAALTEERTLSALGNHIAIKGVTFQALGLGVLHLQGGRRTPERELLAGRSTASVRAQERFNWEEIPPPVLVEDYADLESRLSELPASCLRPRRVTEDFHVLAVHDVGEVGFHAAAHVVQARVVDCRGQGALIEHPYTTVGRSGAELLLRRLSEKSRRLRFVAGRVRRGVRGLVLEPTALVWDEAGRRVALQPWIAADDGMSSEATTGMEEATAARDPLHAYLCELEEQLAETFLVGLSRADDLLARRWGELVRRGESLGMSRLVDGVAGLATLLQQRTHTLRWDPAEAAGKLLELAALVRLASDVG